MWTNLPEKHGKNCQSCQLWSPSTATTKKIYKNWKYHLVEECLLYKHHNFQLIWTNIRPARANFLHCVRTENIVSRLQISWYFCLTLELWYSPMRRHPVKLTIYFRRGMSPAHVIIFGAHLDQYLSLLEPIYYSTPQTCEILSAIFWEPSLPLSG